MGIRVGGKRCVDVDGFALMIVEFLRGDWYLASSIDYQLYCLLFYGLEFISLIKHIIITIII